MRVLVTGGAGFIGSNLIRYLSTLPGIESIMSIDDYSAGKEENHVEGVGYLKQHTADLSPIQFKAKLDYIFHLGEYSRIVPSFQDIVEVWRSNSLGTVKVFELARQHQAKLVYAGSSTRFGLEGHSHSPYSFSKSQNVDLLKAYKSWWDMDASVCYFYNVFGPGYHSSPTPGYESVVSIFERQWKAGQSLTVCGDGLQTRSFTFVEDVVRGLWAAANIPEGKEFQLTSDTQYRILDVAKRFTSNIQFVPQRPGDRQQSVGQSTVAKQELDWKTTMGVMEWIDKVKDEHIRGSSQ